jgi:hypothetical protein
MKLGHLPADVKALKGGKDGPFSSKRACHCNTFLPVCTWWFVLHPLETTVLIQLLIFILPC